LTNSGIGGAIVDKNEIKTNKEPIFSVCPTLVEIGFREKIGGEKHDLRVVDSEY